jgi:hypothetical protein
MRRKSLRSHTCGDKQLIANSCRQIYQDYVKDLPFFLTLSILLAKG